MHGRRLFSYGLTGLRWWCGLTYLIGGIGSIAAGPIMIAMGNAGGAYMILGGGMMAAFGWVIHPWGL